MTKSQFDHLVERGFQFVLKIISSPLMGEDLGGGEIPIFSPLTLTLSLQGRGDYEWINPNN
jgi:hypothetical protein